LLEESVLQVSWRANCQRRVVGHSLGIIYPCENDWCRERPIVRQNLASTRPSACTTPIFNLFSLVAPR